MANIRRLAGDDLPRLSQFWAEHWGGEEMVIHGEAVRYDELQGYVFGDWIGLLTFRIRGNTCEITSLNSLLEGQGIGTALLESVIEDAAIKKCRRVFLVTTNDNLHALGFYQRRGFELVAIHRGALHKARKIKPSIPLMGENNIPLRDEIELEMLLLTS
jgi:GNAT superfamily N-acetyltransferase